MAFIGTNLFLGNNLIGRAYLGNAEVVSNPFNVPEAPSIVTNGLVLYMNSSIAASYPGSGTEWYNLVAGKPITGSLINGVTYKDGYLQTNGTNQYISIPVGSGDTSLALYPATTMGATRYADTSGNGRMMSAQDPRNWLLGHYNDTTLNYYSETIITGVPGGPNDTNWRIYTGTAGDSNGFNFYVNGALNTGPVAGAGSSLYGMEIGRQYNGTEYSSGSVAFVMVYNKVLSAAEVTQNYNALKSTVGLT
jgi:hypothetical protein